jgi:prepilin-type N-terminal cleavage/methylation domain-containing protein
MSTSRSDRGFSLVELVVALGIVGITLASAVPFFALHARKMKGAAFRLEAQQGMRASLDAMARDIRLAGACLPTAGRFVALEGADGATGDRITVRAGIVQQGTSCVTAGLSAAANAGDTAVQVADATPFAGTKIVFVSHPNGSGELQDVTGTSATTISLGAGLSQAYPGPATQGNPSNPANVIAVDERIYQLDKTDPNNPLLTLTVNRTAPQAFAVGVTDLQIRYTLDRNCPPCDVVDLPPDTATWWLVNDVLLTAAVTTVGTVRPEDRVTFVANTRAKPRNLLP